MDEFRRVADVDAAALRWTRASDSPRSFELRAGDALIARLSFPHGTGSLAHSTQADGAFTLKRGGFLAPHISIRSDPAGPDLARLSVHHGTGILDIGTRASYRLHRAGLLVPAWQLADSGGRPLADIEPVAEGRHLAGGLATVSTLGRSSPDVLLALVAAWYFIVLAWFEDEAVAASRAVLSALS